MVQSMKIDFTFALRALTGILFASGVVSGARRQPPSPGASVFVQNCAFCHGRDAGGGEEGPDLTRSKLVAEDVGGDKIGPVVLNGRQEKGMPRFKLGDQEMKDLAAYIHAQKKLAESQKGGRRGVEVADLQTGNVEAGKTIFQWGREVRELPFANGRFGRRGVAAMRD